MNELLPGFRIGHYTNRPLGTGCTVVLCEAGAVGGVDVRGSAPGTRETDLLDPANTVNEVHAVVLGGGSAFGLGAADGVMRYLYERGVGVNVGVARVPIVPAAILFDLGLGPVAWPDAAAGYTACQTATNAVPAEGSVGAGTGATVGKLLGPAGMMKGGIGYAAVTTGGGATISALLAVNAVGDVVDSRSGRIVAGARWPHGGFADSVALLVQEAAEPPLSGLNTTIGVLMTDAALTKAQARAVARAAHDGLAWAIRPTHTMHDGDTLFVLARGDKPVDVLSLSTAAVLAVSRAVVRAIEAAEGLHGVPSARDLA